jgi:hypothetical protein
VSEPAVPSDNARFGWESRPRLVGLGLLVALLIALVVLASRSAAGPGGDGRANAGPAIAIVHGIEIVGLAVELLALLLLVLFFRPTRRRQEDDEDQIYHEPVRMHWALRVLLVSLPMLVSAGLIAILYRFLAANQPLAQAPLVGTPPTPEPGGFVDQVTGSLGLSWWELLLAALLAAAALVAIVRALRLPPPTARTELEPPPTERMLATAVRAGLRDARLEPDPRRAVIAAYATMEQLLAAQGLPRRAVEAPLEYLARLFAALDVSGEALRTLTDLFELARFSHHPISSAAKERAIAALTTIEQELPAP